MRLPFSRSYVPVRNIKGKWGQCSYCDFYSLILVHDLHDLERRNYLPTIHSISDCFKNRSNVNEYSTTRLLLWMHCRCCVTLTLLSLSLGCDSKAITNLLCARTNAQRLKIELEYKTMYGRVRLQSMLYFLFHS